MSYTKTNWKDGDVISAEKMNKIEQGIADAGSSGVEYDLIITKYLTSDGEGFLGCTVRGKSFEELWTKVTSFIPIKCIVITKYEGMSDFRLEEDNNAYIGFNSPIWIDDQSIEVDLIRFDISSIVISENYITDSSNTDPYTYDEETSYYHYAHEYNENSGK